MFFIRVLLFTLFGLIILFAIVCATFLPPVIGSALLVFIIVFSGIAIDLIFDPRGRHTRRNEPR